VVEDDTMRAVATRARAELRGHMPSVVAIALLLGLTGGLVLAVALGARRTASAFPRLLQASNADDLFLEAEPARQGQLERLPGVAEHGRVALMLLTGVGPNQTIDDNFVNLAVASADGRAYYTIDRPAIVAGRMARPDRASEIVVNERLARLQHLQPGAEVTFYQFTLTEAAELSGPGPHRVSSHQLQVTFTVTGIERQSEEVVRDPRRDATRMLLTPAYYAGHRNGVEDEASVIRLLGGASAVDRYKDDVKRIIAGDASPSVLFRERELLTSRVQRAIRPQVAAMGLFALLVGVAGISVIGQILARRVVLMGDDASVLRALGMTKPQIAGVELLRAAATVVPGAILATVIAVAASPLTPIGVARRAEPAPGVAVDWLVLGIGVAAFVVLLLGAVAITALRMAGASAHLRGTRHTGRRRASRLGQFTWRAGLPVSAVAGVRMATEPGGGHTAVPVRSTVIGTTLALALVAASLGFGASLGHLVGTPRLYGWNWGTMLDSGFGSAKRTEVLSAVQAEPSLQAVSGGTYGRVTIGAIDVPAVGIDMLRGSAFPTILEGHSARAPDEVVFGTASLRRIHGHIGDAVTFTAAGRPVTARIVGRAVFPSLGEGDFTPTSLGEGAALTAQGLQRADPSASKDGYNFVVVTGPAHDDGAISRLRSTVYRDDVFTITDQQPVDIATYSQIRQTPLLLAGVVGVLAVSLIAHALVTSVRRRARDLAILKVLGFRRRQVFAAVAWQATTFAVLTTAVGLPIGLALARWAWLLFARQLGVVAPAVVPPFPLVLVVTITVVLANAAAALPGWLAARVRPSTVLRTE
jgi:ABC-type antimicrobial peptide transport system permease subunit